MSYNGAYDSSAGAGYDTEGTFLSYDLQSGIEDVPSTITFGAGGTTTNGHVSVGASGEFEVLTDGFYAIKQRFRVGRSGAAGVSQMFFWAEVSGDGGVSWSTIGTSVDIPLDSSNETEVFFDLTPLRLLAGTKLRNRFARSSTGNDSGDLIPAVPSTALSLIGAPDAPSAQVTIYKT